MSRTRSSKFPRIVVLLLVVAALVATIIFKENFKAPAVLPLQTAPALVKILDGDTFVDGEGQTIRLLGIDTPEKGQAFSDEAAGELRLLLAGNATLKYEFGKERTDRYGRLLAFVYADSVFVNERLIEDGLASAYFFEDQMAAVEFQELCSAQKAALRERVGIWSLAVAKPESVYYGNSKSRRFHRPSCDAVTSGEAKHLTENPSREYFLGECFSPCRNCKP